MASMVCSVSIVLLPVSGCLPERLNTVFTLLFFDLQVLGTAAWEPHGTYGFSS